MTGISQRKVKLAILVWSADASRPELCATPFFHAAVAAAMDAEVEMHFSARAVRLLVPGVAAGIAPAAGGGKTIHEFMRDAVGHGAKLYACSQAKAMHAAGEELVPECAGIAGATAFVARQLDGEWATAIY